MRCFTWIVAAAIACGQLAHEPQYQHLCTYGSKHGIHPPKILNRRAARAAIGEDEHPYGLAYPSSVVTDSKHRIWIADSGTASIHVFDPGSAAYREIRRAGDAALQQPAGLTIDRQGYIYVTDTASGGIFAFDPTGEFDRSLIPKKRGRLLEGPTVIAPSEDGRTIFVADPPRKVIVALNREGESVGTIGSEGSPVDAISLAIVGSEIYELDRRTHKIEIYSFSGVLRREWEWEDVRLPSAFAYDRARNLFFVVNPRWMVIDIFNADGRNLSAFGEYGDAVHQMKSVDALYVDPQGLVYATDSHEGKVLVFGESVQTIGKR